VKGYRGRHICILHTKEKIHIGQSGQTHKQI
jgi:hypothetical protein